MADQRIIGIDRRHRLGFDETRYHGEGKRLAHHGCSFESLKVYGQDAHLVARYYHRRQKERDGLLARPPLWKPYFAPKKSRAILR